MDRNRWKDQDDFVIFRILLSPPLAQGEEEQENKLHDYIIPTVKLYSIPRNPPLRHPLVIFQ